MSRLAPTQGRLASRLKFYLSFLAFFILVLGILFLAAGKDSVNLPVMVITLLATPVVLRIMLWFRWFHDPKGKARVIKFYEPGKKVPEKAPLETAIELMEERAFGSAEKEYRLLLEDFPEDYHVHLGLAEALFHQMVEGVRSNNPKRDEALVHYKWALAYLTRQGKAELAGDIYRRLLGPYSAEELKVQPVIKPVEIDIS